MDSTIQFDNEFQFMAIEISYIPANWMLTTESQAVELLSSKTFPEFLFSICHFMAQFFCKYFYIFRAILYQSASLPVFQTSFPLILS